MRSVTCIAVLVVGVVVCGLNRASAYDSFGKSAESRRLDDELKQLNQDDASIGTTRKWLSRELAEINADAASIRTRTAELTARRNALTKFDAEISYWNRRASQARNQFQANGSMGAYVSISNFRESSRKAAQRREEVRQEILVRTEQLNRDIRSYNVRSSRYGQQATNLDERVRAYSDRERRYNADASDFNRRYTKK